jgi:hypothetical protein
VPDTGFGAYHQAKHRQVRYARQRSIRVQAAVEESGDAGKDERPHDRQ